MRKQQWKVLQRNKLWAAGCIVTESVDLTYAGPGTHRRYTATIRGFKNFRIWIGYFGKEQSIPNSKPVVEQVIETVRALRDRVDAGDETAFDHTQAW